MAGYTRQSTADIIPTATVRAAPLNAEYNAIRDAFSASGGHRHDGTAAEGDYVPLISDLDNYNKVVIDSTNNRVGVFVEVSAAAVEQVRFQDGAIVPVTTNDIDLGTSLLKFKDLYLEGTATIGSISLDGGTIDDTVIGGTTPAAGTFTTMTATTVDINGGAIDGTIIGATTAAAADFTTMDASGNATVGGTFGVTGNTTIGGTLGVTGVTTLGTANITSVDLDSGAIDNTTIGASTPAAGTFTTLTANTSLTAATADINGGTLDGVTIGGTTSAAATVTDLTATGTSTLTTVDINGGAIDGTTIGASSAAAGSFTTVSTSGQATLATVDVNGGNIDNTIIGATTAAAITGTTITGTSFVGPVTGNVTGNLTGDVTGDLTGDVTGNITSSGSSSFNNVTIDGTLNMNAGTTATITNLTSPTNTNDAATKGYVDTSISNLVDSAPGTLDTLNELAAALGDDPNFSTTITNSIATKLPLAGGTMTGAIAMSTNKITGLGDPTAAQDAVTKSYAEANFLDLTGGTMTGAIDMGSAKITTTYTPTNAADLTTKTYVDGILGSATAASASAAAAATSETNAATSESNAATSETNAATSAASAAASYDDFDDRYLGAKASAPTLDNDGDALVTGALYFNTTTNIMNVYGSSGWQSAGSAVNGTSDRVTYTASSGQTIFSATYDAGYVDVYMNGVKLLAGTDFTATNGTSITLASGAAVNDIVDIVAYGTFVLADHYSKSQSDARYVEVAGDTMTGNLDVQGTVTADGLTVSDTQASGGVGIDIINVGDGGISTTPYTYIASKLNPTRNGGEIRFTRANTYGSAVQADANIELYTTVDDVNKLALKVHSGGDISFYEDTGTTAKFFWDASAESLGIGTMSPDNPLHVVYADSTAYSDATGDFGVQIENTDTTTNSFSQLHFRTGNSDSYIRSIREGDNLSSLAFLTDDGGTTGDVGEVMRLTSGGNVGIGTSSPSAKMHSQVNTFTDADKIAFKGYNNQAVGVYANFQNATTGTGFSDGFRVGIDDSENAQLINGENTAMTFATNGSERMRIDSSGNLLVGKTSSSASTTGAELQAGSGGQSALIATAAGTKVGVINRTTSDGDLLEFRKDGTTVGSIGADGGDAYIGTGDTAIIFSDGNDAIVPFSTTAGNFRGSAIDLGYSTYPFKDLILSGGVYLGGTGAANKLDDYEEGTWTPVVSASTGSPTYNAQQGWYTKVGRSVTVSMYLNFNKNTLSGTLLISGLPFTCRNVYDTRGVSMDWYLPSGTAAVNSVAILGANTNEIRPRRITAANNDATAASWTASDISSQAFFWITTTYQID